jgi:adenine-specific DNA methylase
MPPPMVTKSTFLNRATDSESMELLDIEQQNAERLTHRLFRFPAKFHPPVVRSLVDRYTEPGDRLYDPFCGSGTALVEGAVLGRMAFGVDLDPLAVMVSSAKTRRYNVEELGLAANRLLAALERHDRGHESYEQLQWEDITEKAYKRAVDHDDLWIPAIPNIGHWFRRYAVIDLARIRRAIVRLRKITPESREFFLLIFAAIIRNSSNADPVPVSGLEVTAHMKAKDKKGRIVDPFSLYRKALKRGLLDIEDWVASLGENPVPQVFQGDATKPVVGPPRRVSAIMTSPPYHSAVDYYRRHQLEMFWLRLTETHDERLRLLPQYVGRARVKRSHPLLQRDWPVDGLAAEWEGLLASEDPERARAFRHYILAMRDAFKRFAAITDDGAPVVVVVGSSTWNNHSIPTADLFYEIAGDAFEHDAPLWYPVKNRYMSYARRNGANIDKEFVVVLRRRRTRSGS